MVEMFSVGCGWLHAVSAAAIARAVLNVRIDFLM